MSHVYGYPNVVSATKHVDTLFLHVPGGAPDTIVKHVDDKVAGVIPNMDGSTTFKLKVDRNGACVGSLLKSVGKFGCKML